LLLASAFADDAPLRTIAFGSCANQAKNQDFWEPVLAHKPDAFVFMGDNIYSDTDNMAVLKATYDLLGAQEGFQTLRETAKVLATWDDHDYGFNDSGADYPAREGSREVFLDFWQTPADAERRGHEGIYDAQVFGPPGRRVQVILLDTRYFRSPLRKLEKRPPNDGPYLALWDKDATLLGEAQWAWLERQLRVPAEVRILVSSIQLVAQDHHWEKWMNLPLERARLLRMLWATRAAGVIAISGDRHHGEISCLTEGPPYPLYDITSSGLNMTRPGDNSERNRHRLDDVIVRENNFGLVTIDWSQEDPAITMEIRDITDTSRVARTIRLSELQIEAGARR
jgi:alkaline phosphatase D